MTKTWKPGDAVLLRGIYNQRVWIVQSAIVVKDTEDEVALAILPGAECMMPEGYINGKHGEPREWDRWGDYKKNNRDMQKFIWHTNRMLVLLEPQKYYATLYFWQEDTNQFLCYYINFQLPFWRSEYGFDSLDLELDIVIDPEHNWRWKDTDDYQKGIESGVIRQEWSDEIELAKLDVFEKMEKQKYPLDGRWLNWKPEINWVIPKLPTNWDKI
jgi:protein associated with RNAse G/E